MPDPAVNAINTGKTCRAYCPIVVRRVRNIEVSIVDLPFSVLDCRRQHQYSGGQNLSLEILSVELVLFSTFDLKFR
jgi:hypothetical protein